MTSVFLAWQDAAATRAWYPIGRLDADLAAHHYVFGYTHGARRAQREAGLQPLESFPDFGRRYESTDLFPLFRNRVLSSSREDFPEYLRFLDLRADQADPLTLLTLTEGRRQTDNLEVFPKISRAADGAFHCRFFLHGWRHVSDAARNRLETLDANDGLRVAVELNNPATGMAVQLQTEDYCMIGWTPRYLVNDLVQIIARTPDIRARVVKKNPADAPAHQRFLVDLTGNWPAGYEPMSGDDFRLVNP